VVREVVATAAAAADDDDDGDDSDELHRSMCKTALILRRNRLKRPNALALFALSLSLTRDPSELTG